MPTEKLSKPNVDALSKKSRFSRTTSAMSNINRGKALTKLMSRNSKMNEAGNTFTLDEKEAAFPERTPAETLLLIIGGKLTKVASRKAPLKTLYLHPMSLAYLNTVKAAEGSIDREN